MSFAIERARQQKREDLLSYRPKSESSVLLFVLAYYPDLPKVRDIVNKHWPIIEFSSTLSEIFTERPTMAYRRPKNLRDLLVHAKLKPDMRNDEPLRETRPCGKARCKTCKIITLTQIRVINFSEGITISQLAIYVNLHRAVIGPSATLTGR